MDKLSKSDRKYVEMRLEHWGAWIASSYNSGYPGRNPICDMIEYCTKVTTGGFLKADSFGPYNRDQFNSTTNKALGELDGRAYKVLFIEYAWHHMDGTESVVIDGCRVPVVRGKLKGEMLYRACGMAKRTFHKVKTGAFERVYDYVTSHPGLPGVNRPDLKLTK